MICGEKAKLFSAVLLIFAAAFPPVRSAAQTNPGILLDVEADPFQAQLDRGILLRRRRLFDEALAVFQDILKRDPLHSSATFETAETYFQAHQWQEAVEWFDAVTYIDPQRRKAYEKRWQALVEMARGDALLEKAARTAVRREIAEFLKKYPWDWETLQTAFNGAETVRDSLLTAELAGRILLNYPNSPAGYRIISDRFYEGLYPIWQDTDKKISYLREFLADYRHSDFRETAWTYLTRELSRADRKGALRAALNDWMSEDPDNPLPYERAVHYLLDAGVSPDSLLPLARLTVDKCRGWRGKPLKYVAQRIMEGKELYARSRLNMARILIASGRYAEARLWLEEGLKHSGFGVDDEATEAPFHYYLGVIAEREGRQNEAFDHYFQALFLGDTRGVWSARADSAMQRLFDRHPPSGDSTPLDYARRRFRYDGPRFKDVTTAVGLSEMKESRVAWGDVNGDGFDDLLLGGKRLFINRAGAHFVEVTEASGLTASGAHGGVWADVDLDGDLDLFCAGNGRNRLFLNQSIDADGVPQFADVSDRVGISPAGFPTEGAAWGDLQGDGRPDLYVANYEISGGDLGRGTPDFLYINIPDPASPFGFHFEKRGPDTGLRPPFGKNLCGRGVAWGDFDRDGDQDIYVANYRLQENFLWENLGGGRVADQACYYGVAGTDHEGWRGHTIGAEWGDFDNDGDLDLIAANLAHPRYIEFSDQTQLFVNRLADEGTFVDGRRKWKIKYEETHSDPAWGDVDGDGDLDLYITSIYPNRRSFLYLNDLDNRRFHDRTYLAGVRVTNAWGCAFSDFDNDGDLDLVVGSSDGVRLFRNTGKEHHWLEVTINAPGSGYGTRVRLRQDGKVQYRELAGGKGTTSQHSNTLYFGLGNNGDPVDLQITLPGGARRKLKHLRTDQKLIIPEPR